MSLTHNKHRLLSLSAFVLLLSLLQTGWAADLNSAKSNGWLGEQLNGYLGMVKSGAPADVGALMRDVNSKRKSAYQAISKRENIPLSEVEKLGGKKTISKTRSGNYVQNQSGQWVRK